MTTDQSQNRGGFNNFGITPAVPLERPAEVEVSKDQIATLKLHIKPEDEASPLFDYHMAYFKTGTPEQVILFVKNLEYVISASRATAPVDCINMTKKLLRGEALAVFENAVRVAPGVPLTQQIYQAGLYALIAYIIADRDALITQQMYLRHLRKPRSMSIREFAARLSELNDYLGYFPPFGTMTAASKRLSDREVLEALYFAVPNKWRGVMKMHGFIPQLHTIEEFIEFCHRIEFSEVPEATGKKTGGNAKKGKNSSSRNNATNNDDNGASKNGASGDQKGGRDNQTGTGGRRRGGGKLCMLHNTSSHDTSECKVLKAQVEKLRRENESKRAGGGGNGAAAGDNKPNNRKRAYQEHHNLEEIKTALCELLHIDKKTKTTQDDDNNNEHYNVDEFRQAVPSDDEE
jgi:hypothetical protein